MLKYYHDFTQQLRLNEQFKALYKHQHLLYCTAQPWSSIDPLFLINPHIEALMENIKEMTDLLVALSGLFMPVLFIPQIKLLIETKESYSLSLFTIFGSSVIQTLIILQALFRTNYHLAIAQTISIVCMLVVAVIVLYYRRWPGGRSRYVSQGT